MSCTLEQRRSWMDPGHGVLSVARQCALAGLSRSSYYYRPVGLSAFDVACMERLDAVFTKRPFYGARRLKDELVAQGYAVGRKRMRRLMRVMGLEAIYPKKRLSQPDAEHKIYPYLLRGMTISRPDQVWCVDLERHEALLYRAVMKEHRHPPRRSGLVKLRAA